MLWKFCRKLEMIHTVFVFRGFGQKNKDSDSGADPDSWFKRLNTDTVSHDVTVPGRSKSGRPEFYRNLFIRQHKTVPVIIEVLIKVFVLISESFLQRRRGEGVPSSPPPSPPPSLPYRWIHFVPAGEGGSGLRDKVNSLCPGGVGRRGERGRAFGRGEP